MIRKLMTTLVMLLLALLLLSTSSNAASELDAYLSGDVINLTEPVTLTEAFLVEAGTTRTINLNGFTITGPSDSQYTIDNRGTLIINGSGSIVSESTTASCVRNFGGNLTIKGVTINSGFVAIKNEEDSTLFVEDSKVTSTYVLPKNTVTGTINNAGTATITNSEIVASDSSYAVYATSGATDDLKNSSTALNNSTLEGKYAIYARKTTTSADTNQTVTVNGGEIKGKISATESGGSISSVTGNITVPADYLSDVLTYSTEGANVELTSDLSSKKITVPEGVTLTIPEGVTLSTASSKPLIVNGTLVNNGTVNAAAYVPELNTYFSTLYDATRLLGTQSVDTFNVTLLSDSTETKVVQPYANKNITVDLNGYSVTGDVTVVETTAMTFKDSSEKASGTLDGAITNQGTLTLESGNYTSIPVTEANAITTLSGGTYPLDNIDPTLIPEDKELVQNEDGTYDIVYKSADYTAVDEAIKKVEALNKDSYKNFAIVETAINAVIRDKNITEQATVDKYAQDIEDAISSLEFKDAESTTPDDTQKPTEETPTDVDDTTSNPDTSDKIITFVIIAIIAVMVLPIAVSGLKKNQYRRKH